MTYLFTNYTLEQVLEEGLGFAQGNIARVSQWENQQEKSPRELMPLHEFPVSPCSDPLID